MAPTGAQEPSDTADSQPPARHGAASSVPRLLVALAILWATTVVGLAAAWVADLDLFVLARDASVTTGQPRYLGLITSLSVIAWTVAAVVFFGTAALIRAEGTPRLFHLCIYAGSFLTVLMLDDLLVLHEGAGNRGIPQPLVFTIYAAAVAVWLVYYRAEVAKTPFTLLAAAGLMFAVSIGIDVVIDRPNAGWRILIEDGAKLMGILALVLYALGTARAYVRFGQ